ANASRCPQPQGDSEPESGDYGPARLYAGESCAVCVCTLSSHSAGNASADQCGVSASTRKQSAFSLGKNNKPRPSHAVDYRTPIDRLCHVLPVLPGVRTSAPAHWMVSADCKRHRGTDRPCWRTGRKALSRHWI